MRIFKRKELAALLSAEEKKTVDLIKNNPDKTYKVGVNIRSVRENDLSKAFILNETPSDIN